MKLRILGAHNLESKTTRLAAHLIDEALVLDAGCLTRALNFEEQKNIRAILLSHRHYDHVRDLPLFGLTVRDTGVTVELYAISDTAQFISSKILDGSLYPNPLNSPSADNPTLRLNVVEFYQEFDVLGYKVTAVPVPHAVSAAGFQITKGDSRLFYTGDAGEGLSAAWEHVSPGVLLTEVTFGNEDPARAKAAGHLTPKLLGDALKSFSEEKGYLPRVIVSHMNPPWEPAIREELQALSRQLAVEIIISHADMAIDI